jgi:hypothetical protein
MTDPSHLPRVYGDQEIGRILKRATELQHAEPTMSASAGVTLTELEEIAAYLRRAALEIDAGMADGSFWTRVTGAELMLVREATLHGELPDSGFERIVTAIQSASREHGQPSLLGRTLTWRTESSSKTRTMQIVVSARDGHTTVRLEENLSQLAAGLFGGTTTGVGVGLGVGLGVPAGAALGSVALAVAAPVGVIALSYLASRSIYRGVVARRTRAVDDLFDRAVTEARDCIESARLDTPSIPPAPSPRSG